MGKVYVYGTVEWNELMNRPETFRKIQVDITSHCNARCANCHRNYDGNDRQDILKLDHLDINIWKRLLSEDLREHVIQQINFNGNWGDCIMHPKFPEFLQVVVDYHPNTFIVVATNGSVHHEDYWKNIGAILKGQPHTVQFAVDGLIDTHHIYRRKTNFTQIIENIQAFTSVGGRGQIITTLFNHNAHQYEELLQLAKDTGCLQFTSRKSHFDYKLVDDADGIYELSTSRTKDVPVGRINIKVNDTLLRKTRRAHAITYNDDTRCPWYNDGMIQIDPWANVWPCGHISPGFLEAKEKHSTYWFISDKNKFGVFNNLKNATMMEILSDEWFNVWMQERTDAGDLKICYDCCGLQKSMSNSTDNTE